MHDAATFKGFIKDELPKRLLRDILDLYIFNESDLHSAVWFYIKEYFRNRSDRSAENIYVRSQPTITSGKGKYRPDIVVFDRIKPIYFVEIKFLKTPRNQIDLDRRSIKEDLSKLKRYAKKYPDFKQGFLVCVYDADDVFEINMDEYDRISLVPINLKRLISGRRRKNYDHWRSRFDELRKANI